jgi:hypothetical protein
MRDLYHSVLVTQFLNPVVSTTTKTSSTIDLQGFNSANVIFAVGQAGDTLSVSLYWTLKLQHSDDDSTYVDLASTDVSTGTTSTVLNATTLDKAAYGFGYVGGKRYLKAVATPTGSHSVGTPIGVVALRGTAGYRPVV